MFTAIYLGYSIYSNDEIFITINTNSFIYNFCEINFNYSKK